MHLTLLDDDSFRVVFFDVGQGDATFIETPSGIQILVDGGRDARALHALSKYMPVYARSLDIVIATHPDEDHIGGLVDVLERYEVTLFIENGGEGEGEASVRIDEIVTQKKIATKEVTEPFSFSFADGVHLDILFPTSDLSHIENNAASIVASVTYGEHSFLLPGDAPKAIEEHLVEVYGESLNAHVLKVGHHGSKTSSDTEFIKVVTPEVAIVSAGEGNRYGHPHDEIVHRFESFGIPLFYTWGGAIEFISDGLHLEMRQKSPGR